MLHADEDSDGGGAGFGVLAGEGFDVLLLEAGDGGGAGGWEFGETLFEFVEAQGVFLDVVGIVEFLGDDDVHEAEGEGGVGAGEGLQVPVGLFGGGGELGVDGDDAGALAAGLLDEVPAVGGGEGGVGTPDDDEAGVDDVGGEDAGGGAEGGFDAFVSGVAADVSVEAGGAEAGEEAGGEGMLVDDAFGAGEGVGEDGCGAGFLDDLLELGGDGVEGGVPGDLFEFGFSFGAGAAEGVEETVGGVDDVGQVVVHARAELAAGVGVVLGGFDFDEFAGLGGDGPGAAIGAIVEAGAGGGGGFGGATGGGGEGHAGLEETAAGRGAGHGVRVALGLSAAGDVEDGAGYVGGLFGEQPEDGGGDLFGLAAALEGDLGFQAIDAVGFAALSVHSGVDEAGADGVDADAFFGDLFGEADGEGIDGAFGGGVVNVLAGGAGFGGTGGDVDDGAAGAVVAGGHSADCFFRAEQRGLHVESEETLDAGGVEGVEAGLSFEGGGVVDERGRAAEFGVDLFKKGEDAVFGG